MLRKRVPYRSRKKSLIQAISITALLSLRNVYNDMVRNELIRHIRANCQRHHMRISATVLIASGMLGCTASIAAPVPALVPLVRVISERLDTAEQVALNKWDSGKAVHDPKREAQVLDNVEAMAPSLGVSAEDATRIFEDQIEANKEIQYALLNDWRRQGYAPATVRESLTSVIRPVLDNLQTAILQDLQAAATGRGDVDCHRQLAVAVGDVARERSLDVLHRIALDRAVAHVCLSVAPASK